MNRRERVVRGWLRTLLAGVLLALSYGGVGAIGSLLLRGADSHLWSIAPYLGVPWLPAGIAVAGLLIGGIRLWPAILVASACVWVGFVRLPWFAGLVDCAGITMGYVVTVTLMGRWGFGRRFDRYQDPLLLIGAAAVGILVVEAADLVSLPLTAALFPATLTPELWALIRPTSAGFLVPTPSDLGIALRWWLNDIAGIVLVVPAVASLSPEVWRVVKARRIEFVFWVASIVLWIIGGRNLSFGEGRPLLLMTGLVIVVWAAVRFGVTSASIATLVCSILASNAFLNHRVPFGAMSPSEGLAALWGFIGILTAIGLFLAVLLAERERVTADLRSSQRRLAEAQRLGSMGSWDFDWGARDFHLSEEAARILGTQSVPLPGSDNPYLHFVHPDDRGFIRSSIRNALERREAVSELTYRVRTGDGDTRHVTVRWETTFAPGGSPLRLSGTVQDITERRRLEAEVLEAGVLERRRLASELHDNLGQVLFSTALMNARFVDDAVDRDPALRSPGEAIKGWLAEALEICRRLAYSAEPVVPGGLSEALRNLARRNTSPSIRCEAHVSAAAAEAVTAAQSLEFFRIAQEAITNAIKHSRCSRIDLHLRCERSVVELMIEDDGIGLAASHDRRADGLGMRTMRYRAERAGGTLTVGSGSAGGTVVRALVPRRAAEVAINAPESCQPTAVRRSVAEDPASRGRAADADI